MNTLYFWLDIEFEALFFNLEKMAASFVEKLCQNKKGKMNCQKVDFLCQIIYILRERE